MSEHDILEARRAYYREWKAKNKDKVRESNKRYWAKYAARRAAKKAGGGDGDRASQQSIN